MRKLRMITMGLSVLALTGCVTGFGEKAGAETPDLNACLSQVMQFVSGRVEYTGVNARVNGGYSTFITTSDHDQLEDGTWKYESFGGDMEERSTSYVRLVGNQILTRSADEGAEEAARTFTACDGPNDKGRITTRSSYELPSIPSDPQILYVDIIALYGEPGAYFTETITDKDGDIVARRSGVMIPVED